MMSAGTHRKNADKHSFSSPLFFMDSLMEPAQYLYYVEQGLALLNII